MGSPYNVKKDELRVIEQIKETLKAKYKPKRLFLFGSRANGTARDDSDYDFVMVVPGNHNTSSNEIGKAMNLIWKECKISADIFIYSEKEFEDWKDEFNSVPEIALNTGKEIDL